LKGIESVCYDAFTNMEVVRSKNSVPIRLSQERWFHIVEEHGADETVGKEAKDMGVIEVRKGIESRTTVAGNTTYKNLDYI